MMPVLQKAPIRSAVMNAALPLLAMAGTIPISIAHGAESATGQPAGAQVYQQNSCFVCHGTLGGGGLGPRLAGNPLLTIGQFVVAQILLGRGEMPPFGGKLSDQQIAAVAQYIRNQWGNNFGPVTAQSVAEVRQLLSKATKSEPGTHADK